MKTCTDFGCLLHQLLLRLELSFNRIGDRFF